MQNGQFADVSAVASLDLMDDARGMALTDWDQDGDLDIWLSNRTSPRARFLRNDLPRKYHFLSVRLEGDPSQQCNRDAIGAQLELHLGGTVPRRLMRTLFGSDGYLSQSSKSVVFGLGKNSVIDELRVRWPGQTSAESFTGLSINQRYRIVQGSGKAELLERREVLPAVSPRELPAWQRSDRSRVVALARLGIGDLSYVDLSGQTKPLVGGRNSALLVNLWSVSFLPCIKELKDFMKHSDKFQANKLEILALNTDGVEAATAKPNPQAKQVLAKIGFPFESGLATSKLVQQLDDLQRRFIYRQRPLPLPSSFLIDANGRLAVVYKGPVEVSQLLKDVKRMNQTQENPRDFVVPLAGRWSADRMLKFPIATANEYLEGGYPNDARTYLESYLDKESGFHDAATPEETRRKNIRLADIHHSLAGIAYGQGQMKATLDHYEAALGFRRHFAPVVNNLAWLLATVPEVSLRNGARAMKLAEGVCHRSDYKEVPFLDTLAAAYAEVGRFQDAVKTATKAVEIAEAQGKIRLADDIRGRQKLYEKNQPYRSP